MLKTRKREVIEARQLFHFFCRRYTKMTLTSIGNMGGGLDHATVLYSIRTVSNLCETDKNKKKTFDAIEKVILDNVNEKKSVFIKAHKADRISDWDSVKRKYQ